jgi:hypothetical protein
MSDPATPEQTMRAVRRLSVAIWILAIVVATNLVVSLLALFSPAFLTKRIMEALPAEFPSATERSKIDEYNSFHDWPVERQIQSATVIALAKWEKSGLTWKCIISEILKQAPNTKFYYKVGDEYRLGSRPVRDENTDYGDGQIMFFTGSPASFRFSTGWKGDRLTGLGDMPIAELRELIRKSPQ